MRALLIGLLLVINLVSTCWAVGDSLKLPFAIAGEKKLDEEELKNKKQGFYMTGVPYLSSDPLNGFGAGAEAQLFYNGKKTDPFFAYTPFRAEFDLTVFITTKQEKEVRFECEVPYLWNTKWRLHGELGYELDPNLLYFGLGERSLQNLATNGNSYRTLDTYQNALAVQSRDFYNTYQKEEAVFNLILHRSFWDGRMRFFGGFEIARANFTTPLDNTSLFYKENMAHVISGYGAATIPLFQPGLIYDTRDLETDPTHGSFAELIAEFSPPILGSNYNFNKILLHWNTYQKLWPSKFKRVVFASRIGINMVNGNAPFYEYTDAESSEKTIIGLGGPVTLRGYTQSRFTGSVMDFGNFELRCKMAQADVFKQHLTFTGVPFFDCGGIWDNLNRMNHFENYRFAEGLGLRIGWNENTTLRFDYAISPENQQFFFQFGHTF